MLLPRSKPVRPSLDCRTESESCCPHPFGVGQYCRRWPEAVPVSLSSRRSGYPSRPLVPGDAGSSLSIGDNATTSLRGAWLMLYGPSIASSLHLWVKRNSDQEWSSIIHSHLRCLNRFPPPWIPSAALSSHLLGAVSCFRLVPCRRVSSCR